MTERHAFYMCMHTHTAAIVILSLIASLTSDANGSDLDQDVATDSGATPHSVVRS